MKQKDLLVWLSEKHTCENCGKIMTEYYGSGRFCSKSCANTRHHSIETKTKISNSVANNCLTKRYCITCGKRIRKCNKTGYCKKCMSHSPNESTRYKLKIRALERGFGGFNFRNKGLQYKGIKLDSSYEVKLAENLDLNGIKWSRPKKFKYVDLENNLHYYTPDFYLPDYDVYLDPKNDFLINNINPNLGYKDVDKIKWVCEQNGIRVLIIDKDHLSWDEIKKLL